MTIICPSSNLITYCWRGSRLSNIRILGLRRGMRHFTATFGIRMIWKRMTHCSRWRKGKSPLINRRFQKLFPFSCYELQSVLVGIILTSSANYMYNVQWQWIGRDQCYPLRANLSTRTEASPDEDWQLCPTFGGRSWRQPSLREENKSSSSHARSECQGGIQEILIWRKPTI